MIIGPHAHSERDLLEVIDACDALRLGFAFGESRQEHSGKDRNDGDHDQKLDQSERASTGDRLGTQATHVKHPYKLA
jgi:hypothetical protein